MSRQPGRFQLPPVDKIFLCVLAIAYVAYLATVGRSLYASWMPGSSPTIIEHQVNASPTVAIQYWTAANMSSAIDEDTLIGTAAVNPTQESSDTTAGKPAQQQGQPPTNGEASYPLSTVGKVFFTMSTGQNAVCSGTAVVSANKNTVDTAGHCLYWRGGWSNNVIFCPLYDHGATPYGCWAARELEVPGDWLDANNDFHHDMGVAIVADNSQGKLTDVVGGIGWAYNQPVDQPFYAYGYPAAYPFDGQSRQSCEDRSGRLWQHGGGSVVSIPCNMTGGSSGGPWFIQNGGNWYLNGHNDFISSLQPGHMFSPVYDDTWYALYDKAQHS
ncbi:MAG TPA: hypothetical protein VFB12_30305 [Ktedonobacteraceae bacterium]|nr:hypothetical protein [Ktedonobacteraceae bacterium]